MATGADTPGDGRLVRYAWLSVAAAGATIALKSLAWWLTGSVGLLSDALESLVNLAAALLALAMLRLAAVPPDREHPFGRYKAEYYASGSEGALIVFAALSIVATALPRLAEPQPLALPGLGIALSALASAINLGVALLLIQAGRKLESIALEADGRHLMTDVWTSAGVIAAVGLVALTGWLILDPLIALAVAANIVRTGVRLMARITSPSCSPVARATSGASLKIRTPCSLRMPRSAWMAGVTFTSSSDSSTVYFSAVTVGRSPVTIRRLVLSLPLRTSTVTTSPTWRSSLTASQSR